MSTKDSIGKKYFINNEIFADAFNYLVYDGQQIIKAEELRELDTTEVALPYGNGARAPVQKYRDVLKLWNAMMDDSAIYVILGAELQDKVHYGMPVKDGLYDMIGYSRQIDELRHSYKRKNKDSADSRLVMKDDSLKIKLSGAEFLSGLRKGDKLIPIVTIVVYLGEKPWDGPKTLHEMLDFKSEEMKAFVPDYKINLISPADMNDEEFAKFSTDLGFAMKVIKHQSDCADEIIGSTDHLIIDRETAVFLNSVAKLNLEFEETTGGVDVSVDMCLAMARKEKRDRILGVIDYMRDEGKNDADIINKITEKFDVTKDYVLALLESQKV